MKFIESVKQHADRLQQSHPALAFPVAVVKRYSDDETGKQAALITYYGFLALFPLLMSFMTVLSIVTQGNPELEAKISQEVLKYFPALGDMLQENVQTVEASGLQLVLQLLVLLYGARGFASILQETFNNVWHVDKEHRPGFPGDYLRSFAMMATVGIGIIAGTTISYVLGSVLELGVLGTLLVIIVNMVVLFGLLLAVFRLGTSSTIGLRKLILGAMVAGIGALLIQYFGGSIMAHELPKLRGTYGSFAFALAMMFWLYLQAQMLMYALTITAVRTQNDWPKKLF